MQAQPVRASAVAPDAAATTDSVSAVVPPVCGPSLPACATGASPGVLPTRIRVEGGFTLLGDNIPPEI
eukprot:GSA120T00005838001.1